MSINWLIVINLLVGIIPPFVVDFPNILRSETSIDWFFEHLQNAKHLIY